MARAVILRSVLALVLVVLSQGPVFRWIDEQGEVHYTNDAKSIPPAARAEPTAGEELNTIAGDDELTTATDAPVEVPAPFEIHPDADVSSVVDEYDWSRPREFVKYVLGRRFPAGWAVIERSGEACIDQRLKDRDSPNQLAAQIPMLVRDCGRTAGGAALVALCGKAPGLARGAISGDAFMRRRPSCAQGQLPVGCDAFAPLLAGKAGQSGFDELLTDWAQSIYALTADYAVRDQRVGKPSSRTRDAVLTLTWYVERYLHFLRLQQPSEYATLQTECWRRLIGGLSVTSQWALLQTNNKLGLLLDDFGIQQLVDDPLLSDEIERATFAPSTSSR